MREGTGGIAAVRTLDIIGRRIIIAEAAVVRHPGLLAVLAVVIGDRRSRRRVGENGEQAEFIIARTAADKAGAVGIGVERAGGDRNSVVVGKGGSGRVDKGGR